VYSLHRTICAFAWVLLLSATLPAMVWSQVVGGSIAGTVRDGSGAAISGATIQVRNAETGATRVVKSDDTGRYAAPSLPIGEYSAQCAMVSPL
jgi:Carboxypeptidase regulatory-like domain